MSQFHYIAECVRLRGGSAVVYSSVDRVSCGGCGRPVRAGDQFSVGQFAIDQPMCQDCEPFDIQDTLFDVGPLVDGVTRQPTHETVSEYERRGGGYRHRSECPECRGRRGHYEIDVGGKKKWHNCHDCGGTGTVWPDGRAGVQ